MLADALSGMLPWIIVLRRSEAGDEVHAQTPGGARKIEEN
uniref:Uncharacterized protein n=1 Tax=Rhizobium rhizogenes TaxID=359 RepID=A0A7S5DRD0_RHIRH|nr:hypothetical protein pC5.7c_519 [Rhizobium rhizogenes]QCL09556.1 hypothetical protein pC5.8a_64 [Rhizobium rhizogenes]